MRVTRATDDDLAFIAESQAGWTDAFPHDATWWALDGDAEDGYLGARVEYRPEGPTLHVARYYVAPSRRGSGAGRALILAAHRWGKRHGATRAETYTHHDVVASARNFIAVGYTLVRTEWAKETVWLYWGRNL